jgi:hypothetical protein
VLMVGDREGVAKIDGCRLLVVVRDVWAIT